MTKIKYNFASNYGVGIDGRDRIDYKLIIIRSSLFAFVYVQNSPEIKMTFLQ